MGATLREMMVPDYVMKFFLIGGLLTSSIFITWAVVLGTFNGPEWPPSSSATCFMPTPWEDLELQGHVVSSIRTRYDPVAATLGRMGIVPHQYVPTPADATDHRAPPFPNPNMTRTDQEREITSKGRAFTQLLIDFVRDGSTSVNSWRFFFEDDMALHPALEPEEARGVLNEGMRLANGDGIMYLGLSGAHECLPSGAKRLPQGLKGSKCLGRHAHAFGFTQWRAAGFLSVIGDLKPADYDGGRPLGFDELVYTYGAHVQSIWTIGSNLNSPVFKSETDHIGLFYQLALGDKNPH